MPDEDRITQAWDDYRKSLESILISGDTKWDQIEFAFRQGYIAGNQGLLSHIREVAEFIRERDGIEPGSGRQ